MTVTNHGMNKSVKTIYQNQFQVIGYSPWLSKCQFETLTEAENEIRNLHFTDAMKVITTVRRVVVRTPKGE